MLQIRGVKARPVRIAAGVALALAVVVAAVLTLRWPYTEQRVVESLERATRSRVLTGSFRQSFFPHPGCTLSDVTVERQANQPLVRARTVEIRSSWWSLLTLRKRVRYIRAEGLHATIPSPFPQPVPVEKPGSGGTVVGDLTADGAILDFVEDREEEPARFLLHRLTIENLGRGERMKYAVSVGIPDPPGQVHSSGAMGPFPPGAWQRARVSGSFRLDDGQLNKYKNLSGIVGGNGSFEGTLEDLAITGTAAAAEFEVNQSGNPLDLRAEYRARVNAARGDVRLDSVEAQFLRTRLSVAGSIAGAEGKTVSLRFEGPQARVEDLLQLFTRADPPAITGPIALRADADLPPGSEPFLRRLRLRGNFRIRNGRWSRTRTQQKINSLSARARGAKEQVEERRPQDVDQVLSHLEGEVSTRNGIAALTGVSFRVPGATAQGGGTFNLISKQIALKGTVSMAADVSEAGSGWKSVLLKPFDVLFRRKKKRQGATLPVNVTGRYPRPQYRIGLTK